MSTHTPGPWNCKSPHYRGLSAGIVRDAFNDPVADCRYSEVPIRDKKTPEQIDANARLIAAAPDLLSALKEMQLFVHTLLCATPDEATDFLTNNGEQVEYDARIAIAKAEGKEPRP